MGQDRSLSWSKLILETSFDNFFSFLRCHTSKTNTSVYPRDYIIDISSILSRHPQRAEMKLSFRVFFPFVDITRYQRCELPKNDPLLYGNNDAYAWARQCSCLRNIWCCTSPNLYYNPDSIRVWISYSIILKGILKIFWSALCYFY